MESETTTGTDRDTNPWTSSTNWSIARGSLVKSITFDSSLSPIDGDGDGEDLYSCSNDPLVLKPSVPDSGPCEITICFAQKHEVQQIYVRSTARVYEIYYESNPQNGKEYLCTVRCGIAARDEEVLQAIDKEQVLSACSKGAHDDQFKENVRNGGSRSSEDEWVDVKVTDNSLPMITQDYYEATAQISDADPCISITIRLLSVQNKDSVYVDEVYVFADPVDSADLEKEVDKRENSTGNSLMTMLLPTLMQMSKTKGATRMEDKQTSEAQKKQNFGESGSEAAHSINTATTMQREGNSSVADYQRVEFQDVNRASVSTAQLQSPVQVSHSVSKAGLPPNDHVERALDQLSSRMGRIEDLFLRFEENLLKPIHSIEARLHRVEQHLEVLTNKQKDSELPTCSRFCAPNFSLVQSDSNSLNHSEIDYPRCEEVESNIKSVHSEVQTNSVNDFSDSVNATLFLPSLVVTAPEFSTCDDEESHVSETVDDSSVDKPRDRLTVDGALASALARFVSSISIQTEDHSPALSVKAPEFPSEEDIEVDKVDLPRGQSQIGTCETATINVVENNQSEKTAEEDDEQDRHNERVEEDEASGECVNKIVYRDMECIENGEISSETSNDIQDHSLQNQTDAISSDTKDEEDSSDAVTAVEIKKEKSDQDAFCSVKLTNKSDEQAYRDKECTECFHTTEDTENGEVGTDSNNSLIHDKIDNQDHSLQNPVDATVSETKEDERSEKDVLHDIVEFSHAASVVDFETSVLDVKFVSQTSCDRNCPLEALLSDLPKSKSEEIFVVESDVKPPSDEHSELISVEDDEPLGSATYSQIHVDFDYCSLPEPLSNDGETPLTSSICCSHETSSYSLI
ncbi:uncharacterized protein LOC133829650 [Humulus lupulus]|uniref:uncharacterized protein LOC133829650 n=1 Tax=Humulus lupulus TaxID=3486 RepID=UPI002B40461D|nr:uncharacterized protein LOC133829650 [Humulus lupulus]